MRDSVNSFFCCSLLLGPAFFPIYVWKLFLIKSHKQPSLLLFRKRLLRIMYACLTRKFVPRVEICFRRNVVRMFWKFLHGRVRSKGRLGAVWLKWNCFLFVILDRLKSNKFLIQQSLQRTRKAQKSSEKLSWRLHIPIWITIASVIYKTQRKLPCQHSTTHVNVIETLMNSLESKRNFKKMFICLKLSWIFFIISLIKKLLLCYHSKVLVYSLLHFNPLKLLSIQLRFRGKDCWWRN